MSEATREELLQSFYRVRSALGYLGFSLPFMLILGGVLSHQGIAPSISDYYHTVLRDIFVGTMCAIALFLISYSGHKRTQGEWLTDDLVTTLAGIAAFGVALFPNEGPEGVLPSSLPQLALGRHIASYGHYISAMAFFLCLAYMCLLKFAKTAKPKRRRIYKSCGYVILVMTVLILIASFIKIRVIGPSHDFVVNNYIVLWFEAIAIWAFSIAWLTKGRAEKALANFSSPFRKSPPPAELS